MVELPGLLVLILYLAPLLLRVVVVVEHIQVQQRLITTEVMVDQEVVRLLMTALHFQRQEQATHHQHLHLKEIMVELETKVLPQPITTVVAVVGHLLLAQMLREVILHLMAKAGTELQPVFLEPLLLMQEAGAVVTITILH